MGVKTQKKNNVPTNNKTMSINDLLSEWDHPIDEKLIRLLDSCTTEKEKIDEYYASSLWRRRTRTRVGK
jgi:hypothetical protein